LLIILFVYFFPLFFYYKYLKKEKYLAHLPRVILETGAKYTGYRCGLRHRVFPAALKKHLGMNRLYWTKNGAENDTE